MSWNYSGDPSASPRDLVRFLIRDTDSSDQLLSNEELEYLLDTWSDPYEAARNAALNLSASFTRRANLSRSVGDLSISENYSGTANDYRELAQTLADQRSRKAPPTPWVRAGNLVPTADRESVNQTDFGLGQLDNRLT